ncbi:MAG: cell division protein SepF [Candidatus Undinarchaeales archaeon]|jgi:SepF-like predicted cell division protein (DUF552 family)|nr:cell division protein SepF [Candidatus Undinarchaeales archaeon]MDP7492406.1 cell division protein SepF [Candidatus Undinarchaeales archaeon]
MVERFFRMGEKLLERFKHKRPTHLDEYHHVHNAHTSQTPEIPEIKFKNVESGDSALQIRTSQLEDFADTETILTHFRKGNTIMLVKIRQLREKDMSELKRSINRLKTHCSTSGSDMAGIDEDWLVMAPETAHIVR